MSFLNEKVIDSREIKKLVDFLVKESKINFEDVENLGEPEFRLGVRTDGSAYAHVIGRDSTTVNFRMPKD